ncbi:hypothetical protein [Pseudonocardia humida]|uniref:Uncharacterized protein n=1 Tax=Pseudonocardia humida TaxID=2800819 RepID=A0ABT1A2I4_9PSEU|nr:hypothetical protein [Pseudonocardia humida]MCO1657221.1 hypothetical protein [Pseudonocardia humida]
MARGRRRPERRPGRQSRDPVPAHVVDPFDVLDVLPLADPDDPDDGLGGSAGVREPRRPLPLGPMSGAGALPEPTPFLVATLPDPRR